MLTEFVLYIYFLLMARWRNRIRLWLFRLLANATLSSENVKAQNLLLNKTNGGQK